MKISIVELEKKLLDFLTRYFDKSSAIRIKEYLIWAEKTSNKTQGIIKLTGSEPLQDIKPKQEIRVERDTKLSQLINAGGNPAPLVSQLATDVVIEKAQVHGFGLVGVYNTYSSNGAQAYYVERIAKHNLIGVVMSRSPGATSGFSSIDPLFGTNPIGVGFPTLNEPLVFDMASSAITWYGLVLAQARGEKIPVNVAIKSDGSPTDDPGEAMQGALLPFDRSYKSSSVAMMVELFAGPLVSSSFCDNETFDKDWGSVFFAVSPELLVDIDKFKSNCSELIKKVKDSRSKPEVSEIRLPGERAHRALLEAEKTGEIEVEIEILKQLNFI